MVFAKENQRSSMKTVPKQSGKTQTSTRRRKPWLYALFQRGIERDAKSITKNNVAGKLAAAR